MAVKCLALTKSVDQDDLMTRGAKCLVEGSFLYFAQRCCASNSIQPLCRLEGNQGPCCDSKVPGSRCSSPSSSGCLETMNCLDPVSLSQKFSIHFAPKAGASPLPFSETFFLDTHLGRKQRVGVEVLHFGHQIICGERHILHKLPVQQEPIGAAIHCNALGDPPVPQAPHVGIALQEEPVQALFPDEPGRDNVALSPKGPRKSPPRVQMKWHDRRNKSVH